MDTFQSANNNEGSQQSSSPCQYYHLLKQKVEDEGEFMTYRTMAAYHLFLFDREDEWNEDYLTKGSAFFRFFRKRRELV